MMLWNERGGKLENFTKPLSVKVLYFVRKNSIEKLGGGMKANFEKYISHYKYWNTVQIKIRNVLVKNAWFWIGLLLYTIREFIYLATFNKEMHDCCKFKNFSKKKITIVYVWRKKNSLVHSWAPCKNFLEFFTEKKK